MMPPYGSTPCLLPLPKDLETLRLEQELQSLKRLSKEAEQKIAEAEAARDKAQADAQQRIQEAEAASRRAAAEERRREEVETAHKRLLKEQDGEHLTRKTALWETWIEERRKREEAVEEAK
jgi:hypothetical protein